MFLLICLIVVIAILVCISCFIAQLIICPFPRVLFFGTIEIAVTDFWTESQSYKSFSQGTCGPPSINLSRPFFKKSTWTNWPSPREIWTFGGHLEVNTSNGSGIWDHQFRKLRIDIWELTVMIADVYLSAEMKEHQIVASSLLFFYFNVEMGKQLYLCKLFGFF